MRKVIAMLLVLGVCPAPAMAGDKKLLTGLGLIAGGGTSMIFAFDYDTHCAPGATLVTIRVNEVNDKSCVRSTLNSISVTEPVTSADFRRPAMMWIGLSSVAMGTVVLALPKKVQKHAQGVTVSVTPAGWQAGKTLTW